MNNNSITNPKLFHVLNEIESPLASDSYVRKYNPSGALDTLSFRAITEKTYYGQIANTVDANGWLWSNEYDLNGRATYVWHPYDFPHGNQASMISEITCLPLDPIGTTKKTKTDVINYDNEHLTSGSWSSPTHVSYEMTVGNYTDISQSLQDENTSGTFTLTNEQKSAKMFYLSNTNDAIHTFNNISAIKLQVSYTGFDAINA